MKKARRKIPLLAVPLAMLCSTLVGSTTSIAMAATNNLSATPSADWNQIGNNKAFQSDFVQSVLNVGGTVYAGTVTHGLWKLKNGQWTQVGADKALNQGNVTSMSYVKGKLYVGFYNFMKSEGMGVWCWDGRKWSPVSGSKVVSHGEITSMAELNGSLVVGVIANHGAGELSGEGVWGWTGHAWTLLGSKSASNLYAQNLLTVGKQLFVGTGANGGPGTGVWSWDGTEWTQVGTDSTVNASIIQSMAFVHGKVYVAPQVSVGKGRYADKGVYVWDGQSWTQVTGIGKTTAPTAIASLFVDFGTLFALSGRVLWSYEGSTWTKLFSVPSAVGAMQVSNGQVYSTVTGSNVIALNPSAINPNIPKISATVEQYYNDVRDSVHVDPYQAITNAYNMLASFSQSATPQYVFNSTMDYYRQVYIIGKITSGNIRPTVYKEGNTTYYGYKDDVQLHVQDTGDSYTYKTLDLTLTIVPENGSWKIVYPDGLAATKANGDLYQAITMLDPNNISANKNTAVKFIEDAVALQPRDWMLYYWLGKAQNITRAYSAGIKNEEKFLAHATTAHDKILGYQELALNQLGAGQSQAAVKTAETLEKLAGSNNAAVSQVYQTTGINPDAQKAQKQAQNNISYVLNHSGKGLNPPGPLNLGTNDLLIAEAMKAYASAEVNQILSAQSWYKNLYQYPKGELDGTFAGWQQQIDVEFSNAGQYGIPSNGYVLAYEHAVMMNINEEYKIVSKMRTAFDQQNVQDLQVDYNALRAISYNLADLYDKMNGYFPG